MHGPTHAQGKDVWQTLLPLLRRPPRSWVDVNGTQTLNMVSLNFLDIAGNEQILVRTVQGRACWDDVTLQAACPLPHGLAQCLLLLCAPVYAVRLFCGSACLQGFTGFSVGHAWADSLPL